MQFVSSMECIQNNRHSNKQTADHGRNPLTGGSLANATAIRSPPGSHHFIPIDPLPFLLWCRPMIMSLPQSFPWSAGSHKSGDTWKTEKRTNADAQSCRKLLQRGLLGLRVRGKGQSLTFWEQLWHLVWSEMDQSQCCAFVLACGHIVKTQVCHRQFEKPFHSIFSFSHLKMICDAYLERVSLICLLNSSILEMSLKNPTILQRKIGFSWSRNSITNYVIPLAVTKAGGNRCKLLFKATGGAEEEIKEATVSLVEAEEKAIQANANFFFLLWTEMRGNMKAASMEEPAHLWAYFMYRVNTHLYFFILINENKVDEVCRFVCVGHSSSLANVGGGGKMYGCMPKWCTRCLILNAWP